MKKIGVGIVGCGRISDLHALAYRDNPDAELIAVCDANPSVAKAAAERWKAGSVACSFEDMLANPDIDAVEILTPQNLHEPMVLAALKAGRHVSVQKPMTTSLESADRMITAAKASGKVFKVAENYIFYPPIVLAKKLLDEGAIGEPMTLRIKMMSGASGGWEIPASAWSWRLKEFAAGRGMNTFDHGHHMWASAWYLLGEIEKVSAWIDCVDGIVDSPAVINWKHRQTRRFGQCEFQYGNEFTVPSSYYANDEWFDISGSKGILVIHRCTGNLVEGPAVSVFSGGTWTHHQVETDWAAGFLGSTRNFMDAILGRSVTTLDGSQARHILAVDLAVSASDRLQRAVYIDELDATVPSLHALRRWLSERRTKRAFTAGLAGKRKAAGTNTESRSIADQAHELTLALPARLDTVAANGFEGTFGLGFTDPEPACGPFAIRIAGACVEITEGELPADSLFVIKASKSTWASILLGKARIETAFLTGKLKVEGEATKAIRLRELFRL